MAFFYLLQLLHNKQKTAEETATEALSELASFPRVLATHMVEAYEILVTVFVRLAKLESDKAHSAVCLGRSLVQMQPRGQRSCEVFMSNPHQQTYLKNQSFAERTTSADAWKCIDLVA